MSVQAETPSMEFVVKYEKMESGNTVKRNESITARNSELQFLDIPRGDDMRSHDLLNQEEYLLFGAFSALMAYLQPFGFPTDLLREVLNKCTPVHLVAFQILKLDIILFVWILLWAILSLCLPFSVVANLCCSNNIQRLDEEVSVRSMACSEKRKGKLLGLLLHVLLLLLISPIILILVANEQISRSISKSPTATNYIYEDINTFLKNTHLQISFVMTSSTDIAFEEIGKDLEAVDSLLGKPYHQELSSETGMDVALLSLEEMKSAIFKVSTLVGDLLRDCAEVRISSTLLQNELRDIARQLNIAKQQCTLKDRPLCYTLQYSGYELEFKLDNLTTDKQLDRIVKEDTFNVNVDKARRNFAAVPDQVSAEAKPFIADLKAILSRKRYEVYESTHALENLTRSLSETLTSNGERAFNLIQKLADMDMWRWVAVLGIASLLSIIWGLLICGAPCGCGVTSKSIPFLITGLILACIMCLVIWSLGVGSALIGGHGQALVCEPLYDHPQYSSLRVLLDVGGLVYENGIFEGLEGRNGSLRIADVLKHCQRDRSSYETFHLHKKLNVNKLTNYQEWDDLKMLFSNFSAVGESSLVILGPALQLNLQFLGIATKVNLTSYRLQALAQVTKSDLSSFADQLNTVARQISDPGTARKIDNIAFLVRKLVHNELRKLMEVKNAILYKIATLEVLLPLLHDQINQLLKLLKNIQYFLDNQGWQVTERTRRRLISRIESYLEELYNYVNSKVTKELGKCRPLWEIFHSTRFNICKLIVDPLNGIAFSSFFLILVFLTMAPVVIKFIEHYRESNDDILTPISRRFNTDGIIVDDEGTWVTPLTPEFQLRDVSTPARPRDSLWSTPSPPAPLRRQPSPHGIPPPPRLPTISARV